uniref:Chromosome 12 open reading frame 56 n=1 Tax=Suricata suricatta TaxID=37032 RepID=A0A673VMW9_SURSU
MAAPARSGFPAHTNSRLDAFLRRRLPPEVYDAIRAYEPCIVVSEWEKHTLKYVVLSDRLIYLTENPPKSIRRAVALRDVVAIDLIDDYPQFLSPPDRESNQHIRIIYSSTVLNKECEKSKGVKKFSFPFHHATSNKKKVKEEINGPVFWRGPQSLNESSRRSEEKIKHFSQLKSELFLKDNTLRKILYLITELKVAAQRNFILKRLFWKTSDLFYFLVNKLYEYLPESRDKSTLQNKSQRADELVACIEIIQTLGLMFRETETESSRLNTLATKKGTLFNLLVILTSKPQIPKSCPVFDTQLVDDSTLVEMSFDAELQNLIKEYTDAATALLYEIFLVFQQGNLGLGPAEFAISWMMSFLQSRPPFITFVASIVEQVVKGLAASFQLLSPSQAILLYQQFYILRSCLQYSPTLAEYIRNDYREEFRYFIHMPALEKRLPLWYPITQPATQLFHEVLKLVEQKQCVKRY